ncbi:hypothetical protein Gotur_018495 [Gossypium turneri]
MALEKNRYKLDFSCLHIETEQEVAQAIIRSAIDFKRDPWPKVLDNAKDLVKKMLNLDPKQRLTTQEVLGNLLTFLATKCQESTQCSIR